jgi:hypothetical protein
MSSASSFPAAQDLTPPGTTAQRSENRASEGSLWDYAELCLEHTASALHDTQAATATELNKAIAIARESHAQDTPADLLEVLARVKGHDEEHLSRAIIELSDLVASTITPTPPLIPFGGKLIAPSAFYDSFDRIHMLARVLLSPVIYAEDTDAIGTASINPIASSILAEEIRTSVHKRFGIRPFLTIARLDYENWTFLSRKHFEL